MYKIARADATHKKIFDIIILATYFCNSIYFREILLRFFGEEKRKDGGKRRKKKASEMFLVCFEYADDDNICWCHTNHDGDEIVFTSVVCVGACLSFLCSRPLPAHLHSPHIVFFFCVYFTTNIF